MMGNRILASKGTRAWLGKREGEKKKKYLKSGDLLFHDAVVVVHGLALIAIERSAHAGQRREGVVAGQVSSVMNQCGGSGDCVLASFFFFSFFPSHMAAMLAQQAGPVELPGTGSSYTCPSDVLHPIPSPLPSP